jgi:hypothetical protein
MKHFLTSLNSQVLHLAAAHDRYLSAVDPFITLKVCCTAVLRRYTVLGAAVHAGAVHTRLAVQRQDLQQELQQQCTLLKGQQQYTQLGVQWQCSGSAHSWMKQQRYTKS